MAFGACAGKENRLAALLEVPPLSLPSFTSLLRVHCTSTPREINGSNIYATSISALYPCGYCIARIAR